jgi:MFS family permease
VNRLKRLEARTFTRAIHRGVLIAGMLLFGILASCDPVRVMTLLRDASDPVTRPIQLELIRSPNELNWFVLRMILQGFAGGLLLISAGLLILRQDRRGVLLGLIGMLFYLITVTWSSCTSIVYVHSRHRRRVRFFDMLRYRQRFIIPREPISALPQ